MDGLEKTKAVSAAAEAAEAAEANKITVTTTNDGLPVTNPTLGSVASGSVKEKEKAEAGAELHNTHARSEPVGGVPPTTITSVAEQNEQLPGPDPVGSQKNRDQQPQVPGVLGEDEGDDGEDEETYPEGGLRAWLVVLGSWMALVSSLGLMNTIATFQSYVAAHQLSSYSEGTIGWIFSVYTFLTFFLGIYIGPIFDKHGPRWLVAAGTALLAVGTMALSECKEYWHFMLAFGLVNGTSSALIFTPCIAAVGHFFRDRRGLATGVASTGGGIGGVVFPLMLQSLFERVGWAWAVRCTGFVCISLAVAANFLIRSRLPPDPKATSHPDVTIFRNAAFALTTLGIFLMEFGLFIPLTYISLYARAQGFDEAFSFRILTVMNASSVLGRALPGWAADVIGPANANILAIVQSIVACVAVWWPVGHTTAGIIVFAVLFGFASGANISLTPICVGRLCQTQNYGRYYATCYTLVSFACLVGIPIGGNILAATGGSYWGLILFTGVIYTCSLLAFVAAKIHVVGWKPWAVF